MVAIRVRIYYFATGLLTALLTNPGSPAII